MSQRDIFELAIRLLGLYYFFSTAVMYMGQLFGNQRWEFADHLQVLLVLAMAVYMIKGGGILVRFAYGGGAERRRER